MQLRQIADLLNADRIPFSIALYPVYVGPVTQHPRARYSLKERPQVHVVRLWFVSRPAAVPPATTHEAADGFLFAFLVPALNEALVIEHTLDRLLSLPLRQCLVLVIDDGSDDETGRLVESHGDPRVRVLRRDLPHARRGKGAALNAGFHRLLQEIDGWPADQVIVAIMDADGQLDPEAPLRVAEYFADADVGAVQVGVRISNREGSVLARLQDMESVTYTDVFQSARDVWRIAGLGGNGQFVRLAAQLDLAPAPWTDGLTEDLEQGLRLICAGWQTRYRRDVAVHRREPGLGPRKVVLLGHAFAIYSLLWIVAGYWALGRMLRGRQSWHKTERLIEEPSKTKAVVRDAP